MDKQEHGHMESGINDLLHWFRQHGGDIHPSAQIKWSEAYGLHFVANSDIPEGAVACRCPFSLSLSTLNCMTQPPEGVRPSAESSVCTHLVGKVGVNVVGVFFLAEQILQGARGFWFPYVTLLPGPEALTTPLYFDDEDLLWIKGTTMYSTTVPLEQTALGLRRAMYQESWKEALSVLESNGIDTSDYTW
jgi:hypothetical protein